jgi:hypothetical protein
MAGSSDIRESPGRAAPAGACSLSGIVGEKVSLGQANGPDVDLVVTGTELYASYRTPTSYPAIYDDRLGLFCFARLVDGEYRSTGVPVTATPPADVVPHAEESDAVRSRKIAERQAQMQRRSSSRPHQHKASPAEE